MQIARNPSSCGEYFIDSIGVKHNKEIAEGDPSIIELISVVETDLIEMFRRCFFEGSSSSLSAPVLIHSRSALTPKPILYSWRCYFSLPLDRGGRFPGDIVNHAIDS